jgi:acid phosphatase family membrane protein YuiD
VIELSTEFAENLVATAVDMLSLSVAYQLGISQSGFIIGVVYAVLDAYVVIWQRRRLTKLAHLVTAKLSRFLSNIRRPKSVLQSLGESEIATSHDLTEYP